MRTSEEYSELTELVSGCSSWNRHGRNTAEAEDILDPSGSPQSLTRGRSGLYYSPPGTSYTIVERPSSVARDYNSLPYNTLASPKGTYLGSNSNLIKNSRLSSNNNKKRPISPEEVLRLLGCNNQTSTKLSKERNKRSPASSPPSTTHHQVSYRAFCSPSIHELSTRTITMVRDLQDGNHGFGICVKGGKEEGTGVYISRIEEDSVAERAGLRPGDSILEVNGIPFTGITHEEALKMLKSNKKLSMTVRSPNLPSGIGQGGAPWQMRQTCSWMDRHGRPVSPPLEYSRGGSVMPQRYGYRSSSKDRNVRRVDLCIEPGQSLGLMIRGGLEYSLGIFITGVDKDSVADKAGLMVGDQILEVNGQSFLDVTHDEAVAQLKYHKRMTLLVRDVGKVPHSCTAYDKEWNLSSSGSRVAQSTRKWAAALQMVEEKAQCLLSRSEFTSFCYYTDEYASRHMTIDAFVQILTELLNTPDKFTLMTEIREIVAVEDRARFDELVYKEDVDMSREHSYRPPSAKEHPVLDPGQPSSLPTYHEAYGPLIEPPPSVNIINEDEYRSPSEDSGLGLGISDKILRNRPLNVTGKILNDEEHQHQEYLSGNEELSPGSRSRRHSTSGDSRSGSTTALHQQDYVDNELAQKLSRSFDMKNEQGMVDGKGGMRRHQSMQRLAHDGTSDNSKDLPRVTQDEEGNLRVSVKKTKPILGIAIEGGANTKHPLPRIININENGAAYSAGGLEVGQLILQVDGTSVEGLQHQDVARLIAESFARRDRDDIEFLVVESKKSNTEPKPTALIFLEA